jgi:hypothetical protein
MPDHPRSLRPAADTHADQWDDRALADGRALHEKLAGNPR